MSRPTHAEKLTALIEELPHEAKQKLTLTAASHLVSGSANKPRALLKAYDGLKNALAIRRHSSQSTALGKCLIKWWARLHGIALAERDINVLLAQVPSVGIREVLARFAIECQQGIRKRRSSA